MRDTTKLDRIRAANLIATVIERHRLTLAQFAELGVADAYELAAELNRDTDIAEAAYLAVTRQRDLAEAISLAMDVRRATCRPRPAAWSDQYAKDYENGWRAAQRAGDEDAPERARRRGASHAWHDGYEDYSVGREKWSMRAERLAGGHEP